MPDPAADCNGIDPAIVIAGISAAAVVGSAWIGTRSKRVSPAEVLARETRETAILYRDERDAIAEQRNALREQLRELGEHPVA